MYVGVVKNMILILQMIKNKISNTKITESTLINLRKENI